jgi:hypothetical protein
MTVPQRVTQFLRANPHKRFCDDCITKRLKLPFRHEAERATTELSASENFPRHMGTCFDCGGIKRVIQAK